MKHIEANRPHIDAVSKESLVKALNKLRQATPNRWVIVNFRVNDTDYALKSYGTWIQRLKNIDTQVIYSSPMEMSVTGFKQWLSDKIT